MTDPARPSLGTRYDDAEAHRVPTPDRDRAPAHAAPEASPPPDRRSPAPRSLGSQYARWGGEESSLDLLSGTVMLEPRLVDTRSGRSRGSAPQPPASSAKRTPPPDRSTDQPALAQPAPASDDATVARSSAIMAAGTLVSRVLGLARQALLIFALGSTAAAGNIWDTANALPNMIYLLLAGGVFNAVLIPQLTRALKDPDGGKAYTDRLVTLALLILGGITAVCMAFAYPLFRVYAFGLNPAAWHLGWLFGLLCLPQIMFYGVYTMFGEVLNSRSRFGAFMWSPALANVASILGLVYFMVRFDAGVAPERWTTEMILVLGGSATIGVAAQALALVIPLRRAGYRYTPNVHFRGVGLRSTSRIAGLAFAAILIQQVGLLVVTNVLNNVDPHRGGGRLIQSTVFLLFMLPHSLVTVSLITALYTRISTAAHERDTARVTDDVATAVRLCGVAVVPVTIGVFALMPPLAELLGQGQGHISVEAFSHATMAMMLGSFPLALNVIVQRTLYAYEDAIRPLLMQVWGTAVVIPLSLACVLLPDRWVGPGVALVQSISYCAQAAAGYVWLRRRLGGLPMPGVARIYARLAGAALVAAAFAFLVREGIARLVDGVLPAATAELILGTAVFLAVYVGVARVLRVTEIQALLAPMTRRFGGRAGRSA